MTAPAGVPLVEVVRSGVVESVHHGSLIVLDPAGKTILEYGRPDLPCFPRSSNKPLQAVGMLRAGLPLTGSDLALAAASHSGEPMHVDRVQATLEKYGLTEDDLACPPDFPLYEPARDDLIRAGQGPQRITMNCSGKHAAMLVTCTVNGWPTEGYTDPAHPLQVAVRETADELAGETAAATGVDGCGAPLFAYSLHALARAFAAIHPTETAAAMRESPELVGGTGREDTVLMRAVPGLLLKGGAEGVHAGALPDGTAFALKVDDGAARARPPLLLAVLQRLGVEVEPDGIVEEVLGGGRPVGGLRTLI